MSILCGRCGTALSGHFEVWSVVLCGRCRTSGRFHPCGRRVAFYTLLKRRQIKIGGGFGGPFSRQMQNLEDFSKGGQSRVVKSSSFLIWDMMINSVWHRVPRIHFCGRRSRPGPKVPETQVNSIVFDIFNAHVSWCAQFWWKSNMSSITFSCRITLVDFDIAPVTFSRMSYRLVVGRCWFSCFPEITVKRCKKIFWVL